MGRVGVEMGRLGREMGRLGTEMGRVGTEIEKIEERNLADKLPDVVQKMENMLNEIQSKESTDYEKSNELNDDETQSVEKELRKLGYIN